MKTSSFLTIRAFALLFANACLAAGSAWVVFFHTDPVGVTSEAVVPKVEPVRAVVSRVEPALSVAAVMEKPIFHPDRTFVAPVEVAKALPPPPDFALVGYMTLPGRPAVVVLRDGASGKTQRLKLGDEFSGWVLKKADGTSAVLANSGAEVSIGKPGTAPVMQQVALANSPNVNAPVASSIGTDTSSRLLDPSKPPPIKPMNRSLRALRTTSSN